MCGLPRNVVLRMALLLLDDVDMSVVLESSSHEDCSPFLAQFTQECHEIGFGRSFLGESPHDAVRQERGWKLFMLLPRMLPYRLRGGGLISKEKLVGPFQMFARGEWIHC